MKKRLTGPVDWCQICNGRSLLPVLSLGHQPIVQEYLTEETLQEPETTYPLGIVMCESCRLVQLDYVVEPEKVFPKQYPYRTRLTNMLVRNFQELAETLYSSKSFASGDLVVDIGPNDGTLLKPFKAKGARVVGVEPTDAAKDANTTGIPTIQDYFAEKSVQTILKKYGRAKVITATNVFAHINDTSRLVRNVKALMGADSVFVSESQYLMDTVEKKEFDCIYHEHLRFYTLKPFMRLMQLHGTSVVDAERISAAGGSIRICAKKGQHSLSARAKKLLKAEERAGLHDHKTLQKFAENVRAIKRDLLALLIGHKLKGERVAGLGSAARSNTLLGFTHIDTTLLNCAYEKSGSPKIGLYTPGTHIPVADEKKLFQEQPSYLLVLSWHIGAELMKIMRTKGYRGKFIVPLPTPQIKK